MCARISPRDGQIAAMTLQASTLNTVLMSFAVTLLILAGCTNMWSCGNLFTSCIQKAKEGKETKAEETKATNTALTIVAFFAIGLIVFGINLLLEFLSCFLKSLARSGCVQTLRIVLLFTGVTCLVIALILITAYGDGRWSYFCAAIGNTLALPVAIITAMHSHCVMGTEYDANANQ